MGYLRHYILDSLGNPKPVEINEWAAWYGGGGDKTRRVARTEFPEGIVVSTVFLGLNHNLGEGPPILWETMIFEGELDESQWRYTSLRDAVLGHARAVALVYASLANKPEPFISVVIDESQAQTTEVTPGRVPYVQTTQAPESEGQEQRRDPSRQESQTPPKGLMTDKERRAARIEELKTTMLRIVRREHPDIKGVDLTPDAAIDLFGLGILDSPDEEWKTFIDGFETGEFGPVDEETLTDEEKAQVDSQIEWIKKNPLG